MNTYGSSNANAVNWDNQNIKQYYAQPGDFPNGVNYRSLPGGVIQWQPKRRKITINANNIDDMYIIYRYGCFWS